ncbi:hypothetical protein J6590_069599 [Homalodisca vitripennis]|nr:hypothetical protein J6590_069599 [Homalodisca vitripennis]
MIEVPDNANEEEEGNPNEPAENAIIPFQKYLSIAKNSLRILFAKKFLTMPMKMRKGIQMSRQKMQQYLFKNICQYCKEQFKDIICQEIPDNANEEEKKMQQHLFKNICQYCKDQFKDIICPEVSDNANEEEEGNPNEPAENATIPFQKYLLRILFAKKFLTMPMKKRKGIQMSRQKMQQYLFKNICQYCKEQFKDIICQEIPDNANGEEKKMQQHLFKNICQYCKEQFKDIVCQEIPDNANEEEKVNPNGPFKDIICSEAPDNANEEEEGNPNVPTENAAQVKETTTARRNNRKRSGLTLNEERRLSRTSPPIVSSRNQGPMEYPSKLQPMMKLANLMVYFRGAH